ncbi:TrmB family transcriptional regulator [Haloarchaeobius sp. HME9146]|uniref:TrmB family transcriptional regulator n=1 Tax=Haloarchaeobius sp. HME9146 TaxID=2978732 RepID=UPI0021C0F0CA|nr:helix-turn-helix domain-containing protein [Haloarchaeobius sp. HME9146]MCT9095956.1 TrmB family transcriptional regulator [Haloarchaeobius sp. HME9146]
MSDEEGNGERAVELLQQVGLKEYESKAFVTLTGAPEGTARSVSDQSGIPRPRVYDAMRVLESKGLVETQHTTPQKFRAVSIEEAVAILRRQYEARFTDLDDALKQIERDQRPSDQPSEEVWSLSGSEAVTSRMLRVFDNADSELVLLFGDDSLLTPDLFESLRDAVERDMDVTIGVLDDKSRKRIEQSLPGATVFASGLDWLTVQGDDKTQVGRFLLADGNVLLVSSLGPHRSPAVESAVWAEGVGNGLVVIARRLLRAGLGDKK